MAKRKASSPIELLNGDDDKHGASSSSSRRNSSNNNNGNNESNSASPGSTPKRSSGGQVSQISLQPPPFSFGIHPPPPSGGEGSMSTSTTPNKSAKYSKLDDAVSEKMTKVNESFLTSLAVTLSETPDALLLPMVESYVKHVHAILTPHLPPGVIPDLFSKPPTPSASLNLGGGGDKTGSSPGGSSSSSSSVVGVTGSGFAFTPTSPPPPSTSTSTTTSTSRAESRDEVMKDEEEEERVKEEEEVEGMEDDTPREQIPSRANIFKKLGEEEGFKEEEDKEGDQSLVKKTEGGKPVVPNGIISGFFSSQPQTDKTNSISGSGGLSGYNFSFLNSNSPVNPSDPRSASEPAKEDEEPEEPPKNEFKQVAEDNALYEVRCKVFKKVEGAFKEKGIGQLYVKKLESGKHQVVVRAENNLGTILLNVLLQKDLPLSSKGKDVMTCDPTGDGGKPMMMIIRVKNEDAATELLNKLQEYKNLS